MDRKTHLETLLVISTGLLIFSFIFKIKGLVIAACIISLIGLISPWAADKINWVWYKIAHIFGYVNSRILLTLIFFIFLFPIAMLARLFSKDSLKLKLKKKSEKGGSYYTDRQHEYAPKDFENIW